MSFVLSKRLGTILREKRLSIATAESCTGGLLSKVITDIAGASDYFELGLITYSNRFKNKILGVRNETLKRYGAVSRQTVREMAQNLRRISGADICVSISGIAGPSGGTKEKPVGTVYFGLLIGEKIKVLRMCFSGSRTSIRESSIKFILQKIIEELKEEI